MADSPRNSASDAWCAFVRQPAPEDPSEYRARLGAFIAEGFVRLDRRSLIAMPDADAESFIEQSMITFYGLDETPATKVDDVVRVIGDRLALIRARLVFGEDQQIGYLAVVRLDASTKRMERMVMFDPESTNAALAELAELAE